MVNKICYLFIIIVILSFCICCYRIVSTTINTLKSTSRELFVHSKYVSNGQFHIIVKNGSFYKDNIVPKGLFENSSVGNISLFNFWDVP